MANIRKEDLSQEVFDLYDAYAHNRLERRQFLEKLSRYAVGGITLPALLAFLMPNYAQAAATASDPRLDARYITYDSPQGGGQIKGLLSKPVAAEGKLPGIVVVHENRGLNPYIEDVGRQAALANYLTLAPDALTPLGGYPGNDDEGRSLQAQRDRQEMLQDFIAAFTYLRQHPDCTGQIGVVGFCFGGWIANMMAVEVPELGAAVPFYGSQPPVEAVPKIQAPVQVHFAGLDERINQGWPAYEAALQANGKAYSAHFYPGVNHGFHNNSTPRYDATAATLAWERTLAFFEAFLR
ncbi:MAG: YghX family hydrolase [Bacteroidia bacterium]